MLKKLFTHSFLYGLGPQMPKMAGLFVLPLITPYLTKLDYGIYGVITAYTGLLSALGELGFSIVLVNTYFEYQIRGMWRFHWRRLFGFLSLWSIAYGGLLSAMVYLILPPEAVVNQNTILWLLFTQAALFNATNIIGGRLYQLRQKPGYILVATAVSGITTVILNYYFIAKWQLGYMGWYYSSFLGSALLFAFYLTPMISVHQIMPSLSFNFSYLKRIFRVSLPTVPHNYSSYLLNSSDRVVMDRVNIPLSDLGGYNVGYSFGSYFSFLGTAVGMAQGPIMAKLWFENTLESRLKIRQVIFFLQIGFLLLGFLLAVWSKEVLPLLYRNKDFADSYLYSIVIIMSYVYYPMYWASINKIIYSKKTTQLWKISFIAGILNIALNVIFVPIYGPMAAALTTFICLNYLGYSGFFLNAYRRLDDVNYYPIRWLVLSSLLLVIVFIVKDLAPLIKIFLTFFSLMAGGIFWWRINNYRFFIH